MQETSAEDQKENITFRFSKPVLDKLRFEAEHQNVSLNTIAQKIVTEYHDWHANAARAGMIPIHRSVLGMLLDEVSEEKVKKIAELFAEVRMKDVLLAMRSEYSPASFLDIFESWLTVSSMLYGKDVKNADSYSYVIQHELGKKWSLFLSTMVGNVFSRMEIADIHIEISENTVMFEIPFRSLESPSPSRAVSKK